jgi:hypothetical protein
VKALAILRPPEGSDVRSAIAAHAAEELHGLWKLYREGVVREMYSPGGPGAILILETESLASARSALEQLPLLANDVMTLELIELRPFAAFEMLFSGRKDQ